MKFMKEAIIEARAAFENNEVPVGAVIVKNGKVVASSHNRCEEMCDATSHAEINVIKETQKKLGRKILDDCDLYVTVEPCAMCAGAIVNSRIKRVYIGAFEKKTGCMGSVADLHILLPHRPEVYYGFCEDECKALMSEFFKSKRKKAEE